MDSFSDKGPPPSPSPSKLATTRPQSLGHLAGLTSSSRGPSRGNSINQREDIPFRGWVGGGGVGSPGSLHRETSINSPVSSLTPESIQRLSQFIFWGKSEGKVGEKYELGREIGRGAFGVVRQAKDIATGGKLCCKSVSKACLSQEMMAELNHETEVMLHLRGHPNIVTIMGVFDEEESVHIALELCDGGSLSEVLAKKGHLSERSARRAMFSALSMISHCHTMNVLYRDVKPEHFLLVDSGPKSNMKAIDFGTSTFLKPGEKCEMAAGTPSYWAPEVFDMDYAYPSDMWSCGVMMFLLLSGEYPFKGKSEPELYRAVRAGTPELAGDVWKRVSEPARDLLRRLLTPQASQRITVQEALAHPWFSSALSSSKLSLSFSREVCRQGSDCVMLERLRSYSRMVPFKRAVMHLVVRQLQQEGNLAGMQAMFGGMDTDHTGTLDACEILEALEKQGAKVDFAEVQQLVRDLDMDKNGDIDPIEFLAAAMNRSLLEKQDLLAAAFRYLDRDGDGLISVGDLSAVRDGDTSIQHLLTPEDVVQSGTINFNAFAAMMLEEDPSAGTPSGAARMNKLSSAFKDSCCVT